jgi:hypothetical protein
MVADIFLSKKNDMYIKVQCDPSVTWDIKSAIEWNKFTNGAY